jgi:hypothetical protein
MTDPGLSEKERCRRIFKSLASHLRETQPQEQIHHFNIMLQKTARCDEFVPAFKEVREIVPEDAAKLDPELPGRVAMRKVTEADKVKLNRNYGHHWYCLTTCATACEGLLTVW